MKSDIELLRNRVLMYYNSHGDVPTTGSGIAPTRLQRLPVNAADGHYEIDITSLENMTLNYGNRVHGEDDIYIINTRTLNIYYLRGVEQGGELRFN